MRSVSLIFYVSFCSVSHPKAPSTGFSLAQPDISKCTLLYGWELTSIHFQTTTMKTFSTWLAASILFGIALAQNALPKVDLGYQIQQASSFNVRTCHTSLRSLQLMCDSKLGKYTTSATSAMPSLPLETFVSQLLWRLPDGTPRSITGAWVQFALKHHLLGA